MPPSSSGDGYHIGRDADQMKSLLFKVLAVIAILGAIAFILFQSCRPTIDYWVFRERKQSYYGAIGDACDTLLKQYEGQTPVKMSGQDIHGLPSLLKDLSPSFIVIQPNSVMVLMGGGSGGYQILWKEDQFNNSTWLLIINREGQESRVLFSKTKPSP